jgi:lipoprotein-anchoring transpeptidase ErfK/SrfK
MEAVVPRDRYGLRSRFVSRPALIAAGLVAVAGFSAAVVVPSRAVAGSTGATTTTAATTASRSTAARTKVEARFPAAGQFVVHSVAIRKTPNPTSRVIKVLHDFRPDFRPQEILAVRRQLGSDGNVWYRVSVPMRPNGTYGWIPADSVSLAPTAGQIVIHLGSRTIDLYWHRKHVYHARVAIGAPGRETPLGHYFVAARFVPYHDPFLGVFAVETSAYSKLTEWPGGGVVGIHGTSLPQLLGQAVSHGCVRVANSTAVKLKRYAPLGTPIWIKR